MIHLLGIELGDLFLFSFYWVIAMLKKGITLSSCLILQKSFRFYYLNKTGNNKSKIESI
jgi:hypothetical protein